MIAQVGRSRMMTAVAALVVLLVSTGCGGGKDEETLNRESFEAVVGDWPLTVDSAVVVCGVRSAQSVGVRVNGKTYALNGTAKTHEDWNDVDPIWADNPEIRGAKVNIGDLIEYAHGWCDRQ